MMKRIVSVIVLVLVFSSFCLTFFSHAGDLPPIPLTTAKTRVPGDANDDGGIDLRDAATLSRYLAGGWNVTIIEKNADVNGDNSIDLKDVALIRRYLAGGWGVTLV